MDDKDSPTTEPPTPPPSGEAQEDQSHEEHHTSVPEEFETTCWGCGLHLTVAPYAPAFICGWCGAITNLNATKQDNKYLWWRRLRDRFFVCLLSAFMLFMICGSIWAISPVLFSINYFSGVFHCSFAIMLSVTTLSTYYFAAFRSPGVPPIIPWGSYPVVGRGGLDNYTFCLYCSKPKSPRSHHCRSCGMCVLDMDHHCPFIGNCVGAANHRSFIFFLISAVISTSYVSVVSAYSATQIWPPLEFRRPLVVHDIAISDLVYGTLKEMFLAILRSAMFLSPQGLVIVYLLVASVLVGIGLTVLLWQQMWFIYEGKTYLSHLSSEDENDGIAERDFQNIVRFFNFPSSALRFLPSFWNFRKSHEK